MATSPEGEGEGYQACLSWGGEREGESERVRKGGKERREGNERGRISWFSKYDNVYN